MQDRLRASLYELMLTPGLSGHEERVARLIRARLSEMGVASTVDRLGNVTATFAGDPACPR
jgi:putative aminopeptidase FrvX